jgi:hypothetical protein
MFRALPQSAGGSVKSRALRQRSPGEGRRTRCHGHREGQACRHRVRSEEFDTLPLRGATFEFKSPLSSPSHRRKCSNLQRFLEEVLALPTAGQELVHLVRRRAFHRWRTWLRVFTWAIPSPLIAGSIRHRRRGSGPPHRTRHRTPGTAGRRQARRAGPPGQSESVDRSIGPVRGP